MDFLLAFPSCLLTSVRLFCLLFCKVYFLFYFLVFSVLGHEAVVEIVASRRHGYKPGQRITFGIADSCHRCVFCEGGLQQKCLSLTKVRSFLCVFVHQCLCVVFLFLVIPTERMCVCVC